MLAYRVCRTFEDNDGRLVVGEIPPIKRVRSWPNLESLMALAMVEIFDQDGTATTVDVSFDAPPTETDVKPKNANPKSKLKGAMCEVCGKGPFVRMDRHMSKHRVQTDKETN